MWFNGQACQISFYRVALKICTLFVVADASITHEFPKAARGNEQSS
jgi:hypothetical protein